MSDESNGSSIKPMEQIVGEVVAAFLGRNDMAADDVPGFIESVHAGLAEVGKKRSRPSPKAASGSAAHIVAEVDISDGRLRCHECSKLVAKLGMHIQNQHRMTPHEYRHKWKLPADYPMDAVKAAYRGLWSNAIECLECNKPVTLLKTHLRRHEMTPEEYRHRWGLADDYPMVAPSYSEHRAGIARSIGFGTERTNSRSWGQKRKPPKD